MMVRSRGEVAWRAGAVGVDDVHVRWPVDDPALAVELREERLDLPRRLPALVLGVVALVAGAAGEGDQLAVGRPGRLGEALGHRSQRPHLAGAGDRHDVQRRLLLLLAALGREGEEAPVRRPGRLGVVGSGRDGRRIAVGSGEPHPACRRVLVEVDRRHDEGDALAVGGHGRAGHPRAAVVQLTQQVGERRRSGFGGSFGHWSSVTDASDEAPAEERSAAACVAGERNERLALVGRTRESLVEPAHPGQPAFDVGGLAQGVLVDLGMGEDEEALLGDRCGGELGDVLGLEHGAGRLDDVGAPSRRGVAASPC